MAGDVTEREFDEIRETGQWFLCEIVAQIPDDKWDIPVTIVANGVEISDVYEWADERGRRIDEAIERKANAIARDRVREFEGALDCITEDIRHSVREVLQSKHGISFQEDEDCY